MTDVTLRPARREDARAIAGWFHVSSDGVADYIWTKAAGPGEDPLDVGAARYARTGVDFSFEKCVMAEANRRVVGMLHGYVMPAPEPDFNASDVDPILRPYAELEIPGSFYISGVAVDEGVRGRGIGRALLADAYARGADLGCPCASLIVFEANEGAVRLYAREGFHEVERRAIVPHPLIHYTGDAILLRREL